MRTSELTGALLDYWVARAEGHEIDKVLDSGNVCHAVYQGDSAFIGYIGTAYASTYSPSTSWAQGGPLIDKYKVPLEQCMGVWTSMAPNESMFVEADGDTPLIAICRAVVRAAFGNEVPDLTEGGV